MLYLQSDQSAARFGRFRVSSTDMSPPETLGPAVVVLAVVCRRSIAVICRLVTRECLRENVDVGLGRESPQSFLILLLGVDAARVEVRPGDGLIGCAPARRSWRSPPGPRCGRKVMLE